MSDTSLKLYGKIDAATVALYQVVANVANEQKTPYLVVGASARDMVMHYIYGAAIERATADIDFGIEVPNWNAFQSLKHALFGLGFQSTNTEHRIISPEGVRVDIVPFGGIEDSHANIDWPPDGSWKMNVLGFQEACEHAIVVQLQNSPKLLVPVASPQGMTLLKIIAWMNRDPNERRKDASDLHYLMKNYEKIPAISEHLYKDQQLMEYYNWDLTLASACQLGIDTSKIAKSTTRRVITDLLSGKHHKLTLEMLATDIGRAQRERTEMLINAIAKGFLSGDRQESILDCNS